MTNEYRLIMTAINNLFLFELIKEMHALGLRDDESYREFIYKSYEIYMRETVNTDIKEEGESK